MSGFWELHGLFTIQEIVKHLILTLRCVNISGFSIPGCLCTREFGNSTDDILVNAKNQAARVNEKYGLDEQVNIIELSQWIDSQFRLRVGMLKWQ